MTTFVKYITIPEDLYNSLIKNDETHDALGDIIDENQLLVKNRSRRLEDEQLREKPINVNVVEQSTVIPPLIEPLIDDNDISFLKTNSLAVQNNLIEETTIREDREKEVKQLLERIKNQKNDYNINEQNNILKDNGKAYKRSNLKISLRYIYGLLNLVVAPPGTEQLLNKIIENNQKGNGIYWQLW